jgi:hypothetical protein
MSTALERAAERLNRHRQRDPHTVRLARLASLAVRVEPFLLRRLRQELLPDVDVGVEADLWFSSLVESRGVDAVVLDANVVALLRDDLATDRTLLRSVVDITREMHHHIAPSLQLEETLTALALCNDHDSVAAINHALRPALRTIRAGGSRASEVARWAMRALPRAHPTVRPTENALALLLAASAVLGGRRLIREIDETRMPLRNIGWALPQEALSKRVSLGVELVDRGVRFSGTASGRPTIELPRTDPLLVELSWSRNGEQFGLLVEAKADRTVDIEQEVTLLTLRTLAGDEYELARVETAAEVPPSQVASNPGFAQRAVATLEDAVTAMAWSPDGESLAIAVEGNKLYLIKPQQLAESPQRRLPEYASEVALTIQGEASVTALAWSPDGRSLVIAADNGNLLVADPHSFTTPYSLRPQLASANHLAWSPDSMTLAAAAEGTIAIWRNLELHTTLYTEESSVGGLAFSPDGRRLAAAGVYRATVWDAERWVVQERYLPASADPLSCVTWHPESDRLALGTTGGDVVMVSSRGSHDLQRTGFGLLQALAFTTDGRFLIATDESGSMAVASASRGQPLGSQESADGRHAVAALHAQRPSVAIWRTDGTISVWDIAPDLFGPDNIAKQTCFVIMGFGKKTDFETGRVLDLDASYRNLIKPAAEAAGLKCVRGDEIKHSGLIDYPMYEQLLKADVVVADLSTSNRNAIYELGVRHALRPYTTIVIAEDGIMKSPFFDLNFDIQTYRHLGEDIGITEKRRFEAELTGAIKDALAKEPELRRDSPVYKFLENLTPPSIQQQTAAGGPAPGSAAGHSGAAAQPASADNDGLQRDDAPGGRGAEEGQARRLAQGENAAGGNA